jgi:hypothetical protein
MRRDHRDGLPGYFLIVADFIKWAKEKGIPVGPGRGSGAGSVVAWSLTITDLDPMKLNLLFERFLNPERVSMPDFDIDFCETRRGEVIRYVQERYGSDKVAQIITFGKLKARAVLKDTGRVLQMSYGQVDRLAKLVPNHPTDPWDLQRALNGVSELAAEYKNDAQVRRLFDLAMKLEGLPRHSSTHAAGVVIGDRRLDQLVPLYRDPRSDMPVTQFDMKYVEAAGLVKFDFLGLKTLSVLQKAVQMLARRGVEVDLDRLAWDDPDVYRLLQKGDTVGVFQLESEGMRRTLAAVKPTSFEDIIALVSLYRPGPMDNIPMFGARKNGREPIEYPHPMLEEVLKETYGIFVYQEQVMQAAQVLAGYSLGEADLLRRAMGKKIKAEMDAQRERFVSGCAQHQIARPKANELFDLIDKFAGYGFNKSHAAAYAWLPTRRPGSRRITRSNSTQRRCASTWPRPTSSPSSSTTCAGSVTSACRRRSMPAKRSFRSRQPVTVMPFAMPSVPSRAWARKRWSNWRRNGAPTARTARSTTLPIGSIPSCSTAARSRAWRQGARSTQSRRTGPPCTHRRTRSWPMPPVRPMREPAGRADCSVRGRAMSCRSACLRARTGRWPSGWGRRKEAFGFYFSAHPVDNYRHLARAHGARSFSELGAMPASADGGRSPAVMAGMVEDTRWRTSAKGRRYLIATLSDSSGQFEATVFDDAVAAQIEEAAAAGGCGLLHVELDRRPGEEAPRVTLKSIQPFEALSRRTRLQLEVEVDGAESLPLLAAAIAANRGGNGQLRLRARSMAARQTSSSAATSSSTRSLPPGSSACRVSHPLPWRSPNRPGLPLCPSWLISPETKERDMLGGMQHWPLRITRLIDHAAREHGTREIVSRYASGEMERSNWAGIARDARRLANALERLGIKRGDRVATLAMNHGRHLVSWYGVIGMGGILHTVNPRLFDDQLAYIINHAEDRVLFYDAAFGPIVERLKPQLQTVEHFICFDPSDPSSGFAALIEGESDDYAWVDGDEREPAMLCYTSGTTGNPKGVLYEHRSTVLHAMVESTADCLEISARTVALPIVPMFHAAAWGLPFAAPLAGAKLVFSADYRPDVLCDLFRAEKVTHSAGVPTVWLALCNISMRPGPIWAHSRW